MIILQFLTPGSVAPDGGLSLRAVWKGRWAHASCDNVAWETLLAVASAVCVWTHQGWAVGPGPSVAHSWLNRPGRC